MGDERQAEIEAVAEALWRNNFGEPQGYPYGSLIEPTRADLRRLASAAITELDRVRRTTGDARSDVWRSMLDRIRIHGASGLWSGEDCAIGAVAALKGGGAGRAFMLERKAARSPQGEDRAPGPSSREQDAEIDAVGDVIYTETGRVVDTATLRKAIAALNHVRRAPENSFHVDMCPDCGAVPFQHPMDPPWHCIHPRDLYVVVEVAPVEDLERTQTGGL